MASSQQLHLIIEEDDTLRVCETRSMRDSSTKMASSEDVETNLSSSNCDSNVTGMFLNTGTFFRLICKITGLWNPRKKHYAVLCFMFVLLNILSLLAEILIPSMCGPFVDQCVTRDGPVTNTSRNTTTMDKNIEQIYEITLAFDAWNAFSDTMTYILLIFTVWRIQEQLPSFSLATATSKVKRLEWLLINILWITCSVAITVASALRIAAVEPSKRKFYGSFGSGVLIVYVTAFSCCCVFAVLSCALGNLVDTCFEEISNMIGGSVNDVTAAHQKLCNQLSKACSLLKPWFLVHWFMFGANCLAVFAFDSMHLALLSQHFGGAPTIFMAVAFALNFLIFVLPCMFATRVTWKCDELIFKVNMLRSEEWAVGHPFRERAITNEFVFYAERSKCGFRIGKITFGSSATWISVFLGLLGLGVRLVTYIR